MCYHNNLRFNLISKVNHPSVLETVQMRVPYNVLCARYCYALSNSELFEYQYLGSLDSNLFHAVAYVHELEKPALLIHQLA